MDYEKMLEEAKLSIKIKVKAGKPFEVKDLFDGVKWKNLDTGEKISFGRYFSNEVDEGNITGIAKIPRGKDNHTRYIKS